MINQQPTIEELRKKLAEIEKSLAEKNAKVEKEQETTGEKTWEVCRTVCKFMLLCYVIFMGMSLASDLMKLHAAGLNELQLWDYVYVWFRRNFF